MASFFRSISIKIFGIAFGLLIVMLIVSAWSATAINGVNRQLTTLGEALTPLAFRLQDVRSAVQDEYLLLSTQPSVPGASALCVRGFAAKAAVVDTHTAKARKHIRHGAAIAFTERTRIQMARMEPMLDQVESAHARYRASATRYCRNLVGAGESDAYNDNLSDARMLQQLVFAISEETERFTLATARIVEDRERGAIRANAILIAAASAVGLILAFLVSRGLTRPIARLREGARSVEQGRLDGDVPVTSSDEIGDVTRAFNEMLGELRAKERIKETFGQYVDPRIVTQLIDGDAGRSSSGAKQVATLFFSDIAGFTPIAERLAPATLVALVNDYFATMSIPIRERMGIIDKYIGDSIMAFWVPPFCDASDQARLACQAALAQVALLADLRRRMPDIVGLRRDVPFIDMRIALATGEVVVGSIGPDFARSFTVMGDTVNFASRLEGANKVYGTRVLIDEATADGAGDAIVAREIDRVGVVGREEPVRLYELLSMAGEPPVKSAALLEAYAAGLAAYRRGEWKAAISAFNAAIAADPDDMPSHNFVKRVEKLAAEKPKYWNGIWRITSK